MPVRLNDGSEHELQQLIEDSEIITNNVDSKTVKGLNPGSSHFKSRLSLSYQRRTNDLLTR